MREGNSESKKSSEGVVATAAHYNEKSVCRVIPGFRAKLVYCLA